MLPTHHNQRAIGLIAFGFQKSFDASRRVYEDFPTTAPTLTNRGRVLTQSYRIRPMIDVQLVELLVPNSRPASCCRLAILSRIVLEKAAKAQKRKKVHGVKMYNRGTPLVLLVNMRLKP